MTRIGRKGHKVFGINAAQKNAMWKGDNIGKSALHQWVRNHLLQPELCQSCNLKPSYDLACITGIYNRDFNNWKYLCRTCHMNSDGRLTNLKQYTDNRTPWNKGKHTGIGENNSMYGKKHSQETLRKLREAAIRCWERRHAKVRRKQGT